MPPRLLALGALLLLVGMATGDGPGTVAALDRDGHADHVGPGTSVFEARAPAVTAGCTGDDPGLGAGCLPHVRALPWGLSHGFRTPMPGYTGTLESVLDWVAGARTLRCDLVDGRAVACRGEGDVPPAGVPLFHHRCRSYDLGTLAEGGAGPWNCFVTHA